MTAFAKDYIIINKKEYRIFDAPLEDYWKIHQNKPKFSSDRSDLWHRGYFAQWTLEDNRLFLKKFYGELRVFLLQTRPMRLDELFPGEGEKVFANWYSGTITIEIGKTIGYSSIDGRITESTTELTFENGILTDPGIFCFD